MIKQCLCCADIVNIHFNAKYCQECREAVTTLQKKLYKRENPEKVLMQSAEYRERNKEKRRIYNQQYVKDNAAYYNRKGSEYRASRLQATPSWYDENEVQYIYNLAKELDKEVDHIVPLRHPNVCGLHVQDNLRVISKEWNRAKNNKHYPDQMWLEEKEPSSLL